MQRNCFIYWGFLFANLKMRKRFYFGLSPALIVSAVLSHWVSDKSSTSGFHICVLFFSDPNLDLFRSEEQLSRSKTFDIFHTSRKTNAILMSINLLDRIL